MKKRLLCSTLISLSLIVSLTGCTTEEEDKNTDTSRLDDGDSWQIQEEYELINSNYGDVIDFLLEMAVNIDNWSGIYSERITSSITTYNDEILVSDSYDIDEYIYAKEENGVLTAFDDYLITYLDGTSSYIAEYYNTPTYYLNYEGEYYSSIDEDIKLTDFAYIINRLTSLVNAFDAYRLLIELGALFGIEDGYNFDAGLYLSDLGNYRAEIQFIDQDLDVVENVGKYYIDVKYDGDGNLISFDHTYYTCQVNSDLSITEDYQTISAYEYKGEIEEPSWVSEIV